MTGRRSLGIVAVALAIATLAGSRGGAVVEADRVDRVDRVLIVSLPGIGWADIDDGETPNLDRLFSRSAIANLSTRAPTLRTDLAAGYATLGAGDKAVGSSTAVDGEAFGVAEPFADGTAGEAFTRRTGRRATRGIVHLGIPSITAENEDSLWDADVGALGGALARHGYSRAVIANADIEPAELIAPALGSTWHREAVLALVEPGGTLPAGRVDDSLLESAPAAPFGQQLDRAAVVEAFDTVFTGRSVVLVEGSELARADAAAATQNVAQRLESRERALRETDTLVGALLARVDPTRDAVIVLGPAPRSVDNDALTVVAVSARGFRAGLLRSPTTLRAGSVQLMDIAPSILGLVGVERPDSMRGRPVEATGAGTLADRRASLVDTDAAASFRTKLRDPLTRGFVALQVVLVAGAILVLLRRTDRAVTPITWLALSTLGCITSVYIARLVPFHDIGLVAYFLFLLGASAALGGTFLFFGMRRGAVDATVAGLGTLVGVLVVDVATGAHLQFNSGFGFSPEVAGRFIGLGNISYAFLAAGSVLLAGLVAHRIGGRRGTWCGISVLGVAVVIDGAPFLGADVGGVLTMVPAFALTAAMLLGHRIRARAVVALFAVTGLAVAVAAFADSLRPAAQRTHLGRLVEQVRGEGSSAFTTVVVRKLEMNLSTLGSSDWRPIVVAGLALIAFLVWSRDRHLARLLTRIPELRASLVGLAVVAVLGYALNDQGVVIPAAMLAVSSPVLVTLVLLRPPAAPEEPTAASTASSASAPPRP